MQKRKRYRYNPKARAKIRASVPFPDSLMEEVIEACEHIASTHVYDVAFWPRFMKWDAADDRITKILDHLFKAHELAYFEGDAKQAEVFWARVLSDKYGEVADHRWDKFWSFLRSIVAAHHYLRRWSEQTAKNREWCTDISLTHFEGVFLKELACTYYQLLGKLPGRSKSTVGPFIRFAHSAMAPVLGPRMPSLEALNDRWARLKYDVRSKELNETGVELFRKYFA